MFIDYDLITLGNAFCKIQTSFTIEPILYKLLSTSLNSSFSDMQTHEWRKHLSLRNNKKFWKDFMS